MAAETPSLQNPSKDYQPLSRSDYWLYLIVVLSWSFSWLPLRYQLGIIEPPVSVCYRFLLASSIMIFICLYKKHPLKFSFPLHLRFIFLGICMFSTNFMLFYYAGKDIVSGLLAVIFASTTLWNIINARIYLGQKIGHRTLFGVIIGLFGLCFIFYPQLRLAFDSGLQTNIFGLALALCGAICFSTGNIMSVSLQKQNISVLSSSTWGMIYGAIFMALIAMVINADFIFDYSMKYILSLVYLVLIASVIAFLSYLTLLRRIGPGRGAYATILFPVGALIVSHFVEDYQITWEILFGAMGVLLGNAIVLSRK